MRFWFHLVVFAAIAIIATSLLQSSASRAQSAPEKAPDFLDKIAADRTDQIGMGSQEYSAIT